MVFKNYKYFMFCSKCYQELHFNQYNSVTITLPNQHQLL